MRLRPLLDQLEDRYRLPLFEILQGTLTGMSPQQYQTFRVSVNQLVAADQKVDLFEFFTRHHLLVHLDRRFGRISPPRVKYHALNPLREPICRLLGVLVRVGHEDRQKAEGAWQAAIDVLEKPWQDQQQFLSDRFDHRDLEAAIDKVNYASPSIKKRVLTAMAVAITFDKQVTVPEAELFRALAESLDCPVPPVVASTVRSSTSSS
jgi:hypothetical protein